MPRIYCPVPLFPGAQVDLPPAAARHVQVLRMQPGDHLTLFSGGMTDPAAEADSPNHEGAPVGGEFTATIQRMGRNDVQVVVDAHDPVEREPQAQVHLVVGMPANDRMDWLVEKATELGVASIQPLVTERSVLRLSGERATKKQAHWQSIAIAACEQCGRNRVPWLHEVLPLAKWLASCHADHPQAQTPTPDGAGASALNHRLILSFGEGSRLLGPWLDEGHLPLSRSFTVLSGPEGGLSPQEEAAAAAHGFVGVTLGARVLRAETAPLALLSVLTLR